MIVPVQGAQAVTRALHVLRAVARTRVIGITLAQLVRETKLNKPTAHRLLLALIAEGMVEQDQDSLRYFVGHECYALGGVANERFGYGRTASDGVARLAQLSGDSAFFSIRSDVFAACVLREDGDYPLKTHVLQPGTRHPLGVGAGSLAILAALRDAEIERCLDANAEVLAVKYPKWSAAMLRELVNVTRARGYSVNEGLVAAGSWGLGAAVYSPQGEVVGAFSIAAVEAHLQPARQEELAPYVIAEARLLETHLKQLETVRADHVDTKGRFNTHGGPTV
ncbi:IclR family transcriptional regulator [Glaciimonas immobilis]|uniref:DNA-binding IclR family transcriptional regulator n=1 Tax=Glaciimonas immobilis TaxID=728004 RepID=A0A840RK79_9BURK|nr:IclR family transcriptional regulator [Glaciimonas immobilis]KAF3998812.1 IclR family transcriptional regulator [Glaciimonas immobilis]MBB5198193.1 DNA-binding IclR family transcriptional regulator [Glaciimonas immobilis]